MKSIKRKLLGFEVVVRTLGEIELADELLEVERRWKARYIAFTSGRRMRAIGLAVLGRVLRCATPCP